MSGSGGLQGYLRYFLPSFSQALFLMVLLGILGAGKSTLLYDGDTGYHIRAGEIILREMSVPRQDPFSFISPALPWTAHEWLSEAVMALVHKAFGLAGIVYLFALVLAATYWMLFRSIRAYRRNILLDLLILVLVVLSSLIHWLARPHVFSLLLTVFLYHILILHQEDRENHLYLVPPMMLLWVNLHGGFIAGFVVMAIFLCGYLVQFLASKNQERSRSGKKGRQLLLVCAASTLAAVVNPYGVHAFTFPFRLISETYLMDNTLEFMSPNFHNVVPYKYLLLFLIGMLCVSKERLRLTETMLVLLFTSMSLYSSRYIPLCAIVYAPVLSRHGDILLRQLEGSVPRFLRGRSEVYGSIDASAKGHAIIAVAFTVFVVFAASGKTSSRFNEKTNPMAAVDFLRNNTIKGNMYNTDEIGDYVIYWLYPRYKVFVDGRSDMYGSRIFKEYNIVSRFEPGWEDVLGKYDINYAFIYTDSVLARHLSTDAGWRSIYSDNVATIFLRNTRENSEALARHAPAGTVPASGR